MTATPGMKLGTSGDPRRPRSAVRLASHPITADIWPTHGARIASLRDQREGYEWMARPEGDRSLPSNRVGDDFADSPLIGADECFPTVGQSRWNDRAIPDHGEVWARSWDVASDENVSCTTTCKLLCLPLTIERRALAEAGSLHLEYSVSNRAESHMPFLWAWHPLFVLPSLASLAFEGVSSKPRVESTIGLDQGCIEALSEDFGEAHPIRRLELGRSTQPTAAKIFFPCDREGSALLADEHRGCSLSIMWAGERLTGLGIWINRGGWNGLHHVAIEPTTTPVESMEDVPPAEFLGPGESACWSLKLSVTRL